MTSPTSVEQLSGAPTSHGLFEDVGGLQHGRTRLDLEGFGFDSVRELPLYVFNLVNDDETIVGQYQFAPGAPEAVGEIGNAGGFVEAEFRNRGHSQDAVRALGMLALRHGMTTFIITCPKDNHSARKALNHVGADVADGAGNVCIYEIPASKA